jgi:putative CocE/NonD family hydrolase
LISTESPGTEERDKYRTPESLVLAAANKPVLAYATPTLNKDVRVWGPLSVVLYGTSTTLDTVWFVKLGDVEADDAVTLLTKGHLKASYREIDEANSRLGQPFHPFQNPVPPEPNIVYEYQIEMSPIFHTFKTGHKIWVQIASHDFDYHTRQNTVYTSEMLPVPAENAIYHDLAHPSHLLLPVIPDAPIIKQVEPPVSEMSEYDFQFDLIYGEQ